MLLAAADVPSWVGIPTGIAGLGIPVYLWLSGRVMLRGDHEDRMAEQAAAHERDRRDWRERLAHLLADRNAWREAQQQEARAVLEAQRGTAALMDTSAISRDLLAALRDSLERR